MSAQQHSIRDILYEPPGPKQKRRIITATVISLAALGLLIFFIIRQFYITGQLDEKYWSFFLRATTWRFIGQGIIGTLEAAGAAGGIAIAAGFFLMLGRTCRFKILNGICIGLIEFTRGVPTLLFIYFFFLVAPQFGIALPSFWRICLPVAISACGVVAEVFRSGVKAVPKGQGEAATALGMRRSTTFFRIIFPQAFKYVLPALIAELVIVVKDTTFAYVVNFPDLMQNGRVLISNYDAMLSIYLVIAVIYILINYVINKIAIFAQLRVNKV